MKLQGNEKISSEVGTYIGTLTWIDWEHNRGKAMLDPKPGESPVEVDCTFRFAGQHWIWNMDSYPEEDIASHSAFAFCHGDRVILLHPAPAKKMDDGKGNMIVDPDSPKYAAVAVLKEEGEGAAKTRALSKRKPWPLYRLGHKAVVLNYKYRGLDNKGAGFPFVSDDGKRTLVGEFDDQQGHKRAFGTPERDGGTGNPRLVVTMEPDAATGGTNYIPHAIHEFCEDGENIPYVPDVLMQTAPNYRGRIVGWSAQDEILIDNIPVARVSGAAANLEEIVPSWKATTRKFVVLDEEHNTLSVVYVTMDCNFDWRPREKSGTPGGAQDEGWYPPKYAFFVQAGTTELDSLCIYAAMETPREELPEIVLRPSEQDSWLWTDLQAQEPNYILDNQADNFSDGAVEVYASGTAVDAEMFFWGGVVMTGTAEPGKRRKIGLRINTAAGGGLSISKFIGELELYSQFTEENLRSFVTHKSGYIEQDVAELLKPVETVAASLGQSTLSVRVSGHDRYTLTPSTRRAVYDTDLRKQYIHRGPEGAFIIATERQTLSGSNSLDTGEEDDVRATMSMIIFTHTDLRHGIYGYWEVTWLDDVRCADIYPLGGRDTGRKVKWQYYLCTHWWKTPSFHVEVDVPYGDGNDPTVIDNLCPLTRLVSFSPVNNPGVPGFTRPQWHYCHNVWNLPRMEIDGRKLSPSQRTFTINYKQYMYAPPFFSMAIENDIYTWLQGTTTCHGTKRKPLDMVKSSMYDFTLTPLIKEVGIWPYYKNVCLAFGGDFLSETRPTLAVDSCRALGGILYSDCTEITGMVYGYGEYYLHVKFLVPQSNGSFVEDTCWSPGVDRLPKCTGRDDAIVGVD